jgi:hypothetical protein
MAQNTSRSMNADLAEGMSDGKYKKVVTDRGGNISPETAEDRRDLGSRFDIAESRRKVLGDGTVHVTPDYVDFPVGRSLDGLF